MKKATLIRCALLLTLCAANVRGWAQNETVIFSEDFSGFTKGNPNQTFTCKGWTYTDCEYNTNVNSLQMKNGSLTSPIVNICDNFIISFGYANGNKSTQDLSATFTVISNNVQLYSKTVTPTNHVASNFITETITIDHGAENVQIVISKSGSNGLYIKNFQIKSSTYTLSESWDNRYAISAQSGSNVDATLDRKFTPDIWNTLCLPFDVTTASVKLAFGQDTDPQLRVFSSVENNTMIFTAPTTTIAAGTPFLLKLSSESITPTFSGVTISNTAAQTITKTENSNDYSFIGTYSPVSIAATDLFLKANGNLYHPSSTNLTLKGLRAYFRMPTETPQAGAARISIANDDGTATVLSPATIRNPQSAESYYTLDGRRIDSPTASGIYIVSEADGTTRKVFIK